MIGDQTEGWGCRRQTSYGRVPGNQDSEYANVYKRTEAELLKIDCIVPHWLDETTTTDIAVFFFGTPHRGAKTDIAAF